MNYEQYKKQSFDNLIQIQEKFKETFEIDSYANWVLVKTQDGKEGYIHKGRIKSPKSGDFGDQGCLNNPSICFRTASLGETL